jgi:hypothetical protein
VSCVAQGLKEYNKELAVGLLSAMYEDDADFTNTFRALGSITSQPADGDEDGVPAPLLQVRSPARCRLSCATLQLCAGSCVKLGLLALNKPPATVQQQRPTPRQLHIRG